MEGLPERAGSLVVVQYSVFIHSPAPRGWQLERLCPAHLGSWRQELCVSVVQAVNPSAETLKLFPVQPMALSNVFSLKLLRHVTCQQLPASSGRPRAPGASLPGSALAPCCPASGWQCRGFSWHPLNLNLWFASPRTKPHVAGSPALR